MFDMAFWARRSRCKMTSQMQHYGGAEFSGTDGPCAYGAILGSFLVVLGVVWCHFWSSWGVFGVSGGVLSGLGRSWEGPWWPPRPGCATWVDFWIALGAQGGFLDRPGGPRGRQNGAQRRPKSDLKIDAKNDRMLERSQDRLGAILGRSWCHLGARRV